MASLSRFNAKTIGGKQTQVRAAQAWRRLCAGHHSRTMCTYTVCWWDCVWLMRDVIQDIQPDEQSIFV